MDWQFLEGLDSDGEFGFTNMEEVEGEQDFEEEALGERAQRLAHVLLRNQENALEKRLHHRIMLRVSLPLPSESGGES